MLVQSVVCPSPDIFFVRLILILILMRPMFIRACKSTIETFIVPVMVAVIPPLPAAVLAPAPSSGLNISVIVIMVIVVTRQRRLVVAIVMATVSIPTTATNVMLPSGVLGTATRRVLVMMTGHKRTIVTDIMIIVDDIIADKGRGRVCVLVMAR